MTRTERVLVCLSIALYLVASPGYGQGLRKASPKSVGLSPERLGRLTRFMEQQVDDDRVAGAVALIAREGKTVYLESVGMRDRERGEEMTPDTIFRIASMTKPITSVAVLMLYEEGHFQLGDPVSRFVPEFKNTTVLAEPSPDADVVPAERQVTIRHLLTHTSGLTYHWDKVLGPRYKEAGITHGLLQDDDLLAEDMPKLAQVPLLHQPGEKWTYSLSTDVLGRVVEVVSGMSLADFFRERIFEPLRMEDTAFYPPQEGVSRLAAVYGPDPEGGLKRLGDDVLGEGPMTFTTTYPYEGPKKYYSGGGGLCSTVSDYVRFAQMLLNGGELDGARLLSPKTVALMTTDHVGELSEGFGFGLGVSVRRSLRESGELGSVGTFGWAGFWYTTFFIDPQERLIGVCMAQLHPSGRATLNSRFPILVCQSIVD
jgi:CubicO group peptidase (beta-lactamase class C family)